MKIEQVRMLVTLRARGKVYKAGRIFRAPDIPPEILAEVKAGTRTVEAQIVSDTPTVPVVQEIYPDENLMAPAPTTDEIFGGGGPATVDSDSGNLDDDAGPSADDEDSGNEAPKPKATKRVLRRR